MIEGIPALGPGDTREIYWGQIGGLMEAIGDEPIYVKCFFKKKNKIMPHTECPLEVTSLLGSRNATDPREKIARENLKVLTGIFCN